MNRRFLLTAALCVMPLVAQTTAKTPPRKAWAQPHTPDGQPDLQGTWTNATITPFERPVELTGKASLNADEAAKLEEQAAGNRVDRAPKEGDVGNYNQFWFDSGTKVVKTRQTSLVIDPPDGRVPVRPEAEAKREYNLAHNGDSRGRWDGNTLVVDTVNYNGRGQISTSAAGGRIKGIQQSKSLHVVERFTRTDADTILYEVSIDDPTVYTKPWKVSIPLGRDPEYTIYEYACQEGNYAMTDILNGARVEEKEAR